MDDRTGLLRRLAAYASAAGVSVTLAPSAVAQIVYTDLDPDVQVIHLGGESFELDFNEDGVYDIRFLPYFSVRQGHYFRGFVGFTDFRHASYHNYFDALSEGVPVGVENSRLLVGAPWPIIAFSTSLASSSYPFIGQGDKYVGLAFSDGDPDQTHMAWVRISVTEGGVTIKDYAYDETPRSVLVTGQAERFVLLDGVYDETVMPLGGAFTYHATLTNTTAAPLTLQVDAFDPSGEPGLDADLGAVDIPAGATIERAFTIPVAPDATLGYRYLVVRAQAGSEPEYAASQATRVRVQAVSFEGTVDRDLVPATGGPITFDGFVRNATQDALPYDLWVELRQEGALINTALLRSGVLSVGGSNDLEAVVTIPANLPAGAYDLVFKVGEYDEDGWYARLTFPITKAEPTASELDAATPQAYRLSPPSPNPTDGAVALTLEVAAAQHVRAEVLDALGRRVALLHDGALAANTAHRLAFDGSALPAGVYAVRVVGEGFADVRTLTLTH